ncbi:cytochrome P450 [Hypoxylon sp. FL0543]|nr:cytochrome P450 [Hypoxylon sp. FL0543]
MDLLKCSGLTALEVFAITKVASCLQTDGLSATQAGCILLVIQYLLLKCYRVFLYPKYFSPFRHLPGPTDNHFFFGQFLNFLKAETPTSLYTKWIRQHPGAPLIRYLSFANTEVIVPTSVELFKEILQTHCYSFQKAHHWRRMMKNLSGEGIIVMESDKHRTHRKMLNGPYSTTSVRKLEPTFKSKAVEMTQVFDRAIAANRYGSTGVIDCTECFSNTTLDIMGIAILGIDLGNLAATAFDGSSKTPDQDAELTFAEAYRIIFAQGPLGEIITYIGGFIPIRWLPIRVNREYLLATSWLENYLTELVRKRRTEIAASVAAGKHEKSDSRDLITFLTEESLPGGLAEGIAEIEVVGHLLQFMAAGHETSANLLSWSLYTMAERPHIQSKLYEELSGLDDDPVFTALNKLPYLDNFIKEVLRIYPPGKHHLVTFVMVMELIAAAAVGMFRETAVDVTLQGVKFPKGTTFDIIPSVPMLNPFIWGKDVDEPDPTRWDRLSGDNASPYAFEAFSQGPRICIGRQMALMETKIILAEIVRNFRILKVEKEFKVENPSPVMRPSGLEVRFERITG